MNRQTLATHDIYSRKWLGLLALSRDGDAYTLVDQAKHIGTIIRDCGVPYYWSFERGPWENNFIDGVAVEPGWCDEPGQRWGGLSGLFRVRHKPKPQHKTIEGAFAYLQARMRGRALSVGSRMRGEMEKATKIITAAKNGNEGALKLIWNATQFADVLWEQMEADSARPKRRQGLGDEMVSPNALWEQTYKARDILPSEEWMLNPIKVCRVIVKQRVTITLKGYGTFDFACVDGVLPLMDNGTRLLVSFHPEHPEAGACIFHADVRAQYNRDGCKFGAFLGIARYLPSVPMENFTGTGDYEAPRKARLAVGQELRGFKASRGGIVRVSHRGDGLGNSLTIATGAPTPPAPVPAPPLKPARSITDLLAGGDDDTDAAVPVPAMPSRTSREPAAEDEPVSVDIGADDPWAFVS